MYTKNYQNVIIVSLNHKPTKNLNNLFDIEKEKIILK